MTKLIKYSGGRREEAEGRVVAEVETVRSNSPRPKVKSSSKK